MEKRINLIIVFLLTTVFAYAQTGHILQGVGAVNMSMGGAATAQPLDISGAINWNPATLSTFEHNELRFDVGLFFSSPELTSSLPADALFPGSPVITGFTEDDRGISPLPSVAFLWAMPESKSSFAVSAFGISGFGVTFPQETNLPFDNDGNPNPNWDPNNSNPVLWPQSLQGFGRVESNYMLLQVSGSWAYRLSDKFSIGLQPNINMAMLELEPNPTANPNQSGYPTADQSTAWGFGAQAGLFYDSGNGLKAGFSYKSRQYFGDFELENTYPDDSEATNDFRIDYPCIISGGLGYSKGNFDAALDYRYVFYEQADGFGESGWTQTASVQGFGWNNISVISAGLQFKGIEKFPLRVGYTYSQNPIEEDLTFFNIPATAVIKNAFQVGASFLASDKWSVDAMYHYGTSSGSTEGPLLNPMAIGDNNPLGALPGTSVSYDMTTSMVTVGFRYRAIK